MFNISDLSVHIWAGDGLCNVSERNLLQAILRVYMYIILLGHCRSKDRHGVTMGWFGIHCTHTRQHCTHRPHHTHRYGAKPWYELHYHGVVTAITITVNPQVLDLLRLYKRGH